MLSSVNTPAFYDIVIAGGGLIGTTLAVALGQSKRLSNKKILLLESEKKFFTKAPEPGVTSNFSNRVVAINPGSQKFLASLGIWNDVWRYQEVSSLQVWDGLSDASISFKNPSFATPVAYIVENAVLGHAIEKQLQKISNVAVEFGSRLKSCVVPRVGQQPLELAGVALENDRTIGTNLLVGADGFNSKVRTCINSPYINFNYDRTAVVATLKLMEPTSNNTAWQRFLPTGGPIALLPLSPEYSSLVWSTTPQLAKNLLEMSGPEFTEAVNSAFWREYPRSFLVEKSNEVLRQLQLGRTGPRMFPPSVTEVMDKSRACFPLGFGHAAHYVSRRVALIGDAAHRVHPLAGQGLNLGIGDVQTLRDTVVEAAGSGEDIGNLLSLQEYETQRQRHNIAIQTGVDALHRLYNVDFPPIVAIRSVGLNLVNSSEILKELLISQAAA